MEEQIPPAGIYAAEKAALARDLFLSGHNCAQAITLAFAPEMGVDTDTLLRLSAPFGGGMGRLREVCGAVSGAFMVLGALYGEATHESHAAKTALYTKVQALTVRIREENGSIVCRELLGLAGSSEPTPEVRSATYYQKRPCPDLIARVACLLAEYLEKTKS